MGSCSLLGFLLQSHMYSFPGFHIVYIVYTSYGKSKPDLNVGSGGHLGLSHLTEKSVEWKPSAVSDHLLLHNHDWDFDPSFHNVEKWPDIL